MSERTRMTERDQFIAALEHLIEVTIGEDAPIEALIVAAQADVLARFDAMQEDRDGAIRALPVSKPAREITNTDEIEMYIHCAQCLTDLPAQLGESPASYQRIQVGWTRLGLQVWCARHKCNVIHIDFEGCKHPANTTRLLRDGEVAS